MAHEDDANVADRIYFELQASANGEDYDDDPHVNFDGAAISRPLWALASAASRLIGDEQLRLTWVDRQDTDDARICRIVAFTERALVWGTIRYPDASRDDGHMICASRRPLSEIRSIDLEYSARIRRVSERGTEAMRRAVKFELANGPAFEFHEWAVAYGTSRSIDEILELLPK